MSTQISLLGAAKAFMIGIPAGVPIQGAKWDKVDEKATPNEISKTTHLLTHQLTASIYMCGLRTPMHGGFFHKHLKSAWSAKVHEARTRLLARSISASFWELDQEFERLNPHAKVKIEIVCNLVWNNSPFTVSGESELRWVITASAPMKRKGMPVTFLRKECVVMLEAATLEGIEGLGRHYISFFGPDPL